MTRPRTIRPVILAVTVTVSALLITGCVPAGDDPAGTPPIMGVDGTTGPTAAPVDPDPAVTVDPVTGDVSAPVDDHEGHGHDNQVDDLAAQKAAAETVIREYLHYDHGETPTARASRLASHLADEAGTVSTRVPALAREDRFGYVGYDAQVRVDSIDLVTVSALNADQTEFEMAVLVTYTATYTTPAQTQQLTDRAVWTVWVTADDSARVTGIAEPASVR